MRQKISACVTTLNEENNIERCLRSVAFCDEIVVMDSFSTDRTVELCRKFTDRVYQHEWLGYIGQKNLVREMATHPWILYVDADEEVSDELRAEILSEMEKPDNPHVGFRFPRIVNYLGMWIRHGEWYPDYKLRLFHRDHGRSGGQEPHDRVHVDGPVKTLKGDLHHFTYDSIHDHLETMNRFSSISAKEKFKTGASVSLFDFVLRPPLRFFKAYLLRRGFLDGRRGLLIASVSAVGVFAKYAKLWELILRARNERKA